MHFLLTLVLFQPCEKKTQQDKDYILDELILEEWRRIIILQKNIDTSETSRDSEKNIAVGLVICTNVLTGSPIWVLSIYITKLYHYIKPDPPRLVRLGLLPANM